MIVFDLPFPPGVNNLFPTVWAGDKLRRVKSKDYRSWLSEAGWMIPRAAKGAVPGHFNARLVFDRPGPGRIDVDGRIKAVLDVLKTSTVIKDDSLAEDVSACWATPFFAPMYPKQPMVRVTIEPLEGA